MKTSINNYHTNPAKATGAKNSFSAVILLMSFLLISNLSKSGTPHRLGFDSTSCLEISGRILNANDGIDGECKVELLWNNTVIDSLFLKEGKKKFRFILSKNEFYAIRIIKKGFITRLISVNTNMLIESEDVFKFTFNTKLIDKKFSDNLNEDALDFPIALIFFNNADECFDYSREYTMAIKRQMYSGNRIYKNL